MRDWAEETVADIINREGEYHGWTEVEEVLRKKDRENERLRAALEEIIQDSFSVYAIQVARAALKEDRT
jgi:hypothetical protein